MYEKFGQKAREEEFEMSHLLSAEQARELAKTSKVLEKRIFKLIKESAKEGRTSLEYCFGADSIDETTLAELMATLTENGFKVEMITVEIDEGEFKVTGWKISWKEDSLKKEAIPQRYKLDILNLRKTLLPGETKTDRYYKVLSEIVAKAKEQNVNKVILSNDFIPILEWNSVDRFITEDINAEYYFYGEKYNIKFFIDNEFNSAGMVGNWAISLE